MGVFCLVSTTSATLQTTMTNDHNGGDDNDDDGGHLSITFEVATRHRTASAWISRSRPRPSSRTRARISLQLDAILHTHSMFIIAVLIVRLLAYSKMRAMALVEIAFKYHANYRVSFATCIASPSWSSILGPASTPIVNVHRCSSP